MLRKEESCGVVIVIFCSGVSVFPRLSSTVVYFLFLTRALFFLGY